MARDLFTTWTDYQTSVDCVLAAAQHVLCIYDPDLAQLKLESPSRQQELRRLLQSGSDLCLRIAVRDAHLARTQHPRLMELLTQYGHRMQIVETPESISHLRDALLIADQRHCVVRFDQNLPRCKLLMDEASETMVYQKRFEEIWLEGNTPISPHPLGL